MSVFVGRRRKAEGPRVGTPRKNARLLGIYGTGIQSLREIRGDYATVKGRGNVTFRLQASLVSQTLDF